MAFLKPQSPLAKGNDYFYPLTTADQVIMDGGYRLDQIVGKVEKSTVTLYQNGWSTAAPYSYSIMVKGLADDLNMKVLPHYPENFEEKQVLKEEFAKVSFCSRQGNIVTFECWDEIPNMDIDVDIEVNVMYPLEAAIDMDQLESRLPKLNYSVVGGITEPSNPTENMIWVETDVEITKHIFSKNEPKNPIEGMVWIYLSNNSNVSFHTLNINGKEFNEVYPISAMQYESGAWVDKTAKIYQGGKWVDWWNGELLDGSNQFEAVTGGWVQDTNLSIAGAKNNGTVTFNEDGITLASSSSGCAIVRTQNKINLSKFKSLTATAKAISVVDNISVRVYIISGTSGDIDNVQVAMLAYIPDKTSFKEYDLPFNADGEYYIAMVANTSRSGTIKKMRLS